MSGAWEKTSTYVPSLRTLQEERYQGYCTVVPGLFLSHGRAPVKKYLLFLRYFSLEALRAISKHPRLRTTMGIARHGLCYSFLRRRKLQEREECWPEARLLVVMPG